MNRSEQFLRKLSKVLLLVACFLLVMCLLAAIVLQAPWSEIKTVGFPAVVILAIGILLRRKAKRTVNAAIYHQLMQNRVFCTLDELSGVIGKSVPQIVEEIRELTAVGALGSLYLSCADNKLFASQEAYSRYLKETHQLGAQSSSGAKTVFTEKDGVVGQLHQFLSEIQAEEQKMDDPSIKQQVARLCEQVEQLMEWLKNHPESQDSVKRFTGYYLPTTLKLLRAYNDVDDQKSVVSDKIQSDITGFLDKISSAFQTLRDHLLQDVAMDVSAEISAMQTILRQDGLQDDGLQIK